MLNVIEEEALMENVNSVSAHFLESIKEVDGIISIKGKGLMLGVLFDFPVSEMRKALIFEEGIFTGGSADPHLLRILPPLSVTKEEINNFIEALKRVLARITHKETKI